jgi:hypothetical protein
MTGRTQGASTSMSQSAVTPAAMAPSVSWPSAPMFQTPARKPAARPTPIITRGVALRASSAKPFTVVSGETKKW